MRRIVAVLLLSLTPVLVAYGTGVIAGDMRTDVYLPLLKGAKVGVVTNHTGIVGATHIVDTLLRWGVDVRVVFAPEHGFRGGADAGEKVAGYTDKATGLPVVSLYGASRKPKKEDIAKVDVVVFDIQDVGVRFYTYLSTMHLVMESCAENGVRFVVLDRPNPNGFYVDGPVIEQRYRSFVGMHPIPVVHGMTLGELARMINGEGWLEGGAKCDLTVVPCLNYTHRTRTEIDVAPSPNLPNLRAVYLYPSLCYFEGTPVSIGRGTAFPFQVFGHPAMKGYPFVFTPHGLPGAKNPPLKDVKCFGRDLRNEPSDDEITGYGIDLGWLIEAYDATGMGDKFFTPMFEKLIGVGYVRELIREGCTAAEIRGLWHGDVEAFKTKRRPYLLYEE